MNEISRHPLCFQLLILLCVMHVTKKTSPGSDIDVRSAIHISYVKTVSGVAKFQERTIMIMKRESTAASYVFSLFMYSETFKSCVIQLSKMSFSSTEITKQADWPFPAKELQMRA